MEEGKWKEGKRGEREGNEKSLARREGERWRCSKVLKLGEQSLGLINWKSSRVAGVWVYLFVYGFVGVSRLSLTLGACVCRCGCYSLARTDSALETCFVLVVSHSVLTYGISLFEAVRLTYRDVSPRFLLRIHDLAMVNNYCVPCQPLSHCPA